MDDIDYIDYIDDIDDIDKIDDNDTDYTDDIDGAYDICCMDDTEEPEDAEELDDTEVIEDIEDTGVFATIRKFFICYGIFIAVGIVTAVFVVLGCLFPLAADDMEWAVKSFTADVITEFNGRYLGTILTLIMTKVTWFRVMITAVITAATIYMLSCVGEGRRAFFFILSVFLFIAMPMSLFREVITWASGFANYMPSAFVAVIYLVIVKREFFSDNPSYGKEAPFLAATIGVAGALFMETVTIGNIIVGAAVLIYHIVRFKKPSAFLIAFLGGAIVGAILMFTNPIYFSIADGEDPIGYRTMGFSNIKDTYFSSFHVYFLYDNFPLNLFMFCMFAWLALRRLPFMGNGRRLVISLCLIAQIAFVTVSGFEYFGMSIIPEFRYIGAVKGLLSALYFLAVIAEVLLLSEGEVRLYCIFLIGAALAYTIEMFVVSPVTARSFIYSYLAFALLSLVVFDLNMFESRFGETGIMITSSLVAAAIAITIFVWYTYEYAVIRSAYDLRASEITQQIEDGSDEIFVKKLPVDVQLGNKTIKFVRYANISDSPYAEMTLRMYYDIPSSATLTEVE